MERNEGKYLGCNILWAVNREEATYLSNQLPSTPLALFTPPTCTLSLFHLSTPLKTENVVQRTSPSRVSRTVPTTHGQSLATRQL